jgi:predicted negative regulator of RcsB-dependent stress response
MGQSEKARACFEEGLKVDAESAEAALLKAELNKLKPR